MGKIYIGCDNGVSGSVSVITFGGECVRFFPMPVFLSQDYTKTKKNLNRIATTLLNDELKGYAEHNEVTVLLERPMVNPMRFQATASALRALEATLIVLETLQYRVIFIDSRQWQKELLPSGCKGEELKKASRDIGKRLFPKWSVAIDKQGDADGLLICEFARRHNL